MLNFSACVGCSDEAGDEKSLVVINVYCPRAAPDNAERISFKLQFYRLLQLRAGAILSRGRYVVTYYVRLPVKMCI